MLSKIGKNNTEIHPILSSLYANQIEDHQLYKNLPVLRKKANRKISLQFQPNDIYSSNKTETVFDKLDTKQAYSKFILMKPIKTQNVELAKSDDALLVD